MIQFPILDVRFSHLAPVACNRVMPRRIALCAVRRYGALSDQQARSEFDSELKHSKTASHHRGEVFRPHESRCRPPPAAISLNSEGDYIGSARITADETDWFRVRVWSGKYTFVATTPNSTLDPVIGVYNAAGERMAFNDNISCPTPMAACRSPCPKGSTSLASPTWRGPKAARTTGRFSVHHPRRSQPVGSAFSITLQLSGLTASQQTIFRQAAYRWSQIITGDLPNVSFNGITVDDVLIAASASYIDGAGDILGEAGPDRFRSGTLLPYHGTMHFDSADMAWMESRGTLYYTVLHEIGHVLGIGTIWEWRGPLVGSWYVKSALCRSSCHGGIQRNLRHSGLRRARGVRRRIRYS